MLNGLIHSLKTKSYTLNPKSSSPGQVIVIVIAILMFFTIAVAMITFFLHSESKWTIKEKRSTTAFHLAEAGQDRGYWKLLESADNFDNVLKGVTIPLYDGTTTFTDIPGGEYRIWITTTGNANEVKILSVGRDVTKNEIRAIEAIYEREGIKTAIYSTAEMRYCGHFTCHWGPIYTRDEMDLTGTAGSNAFPVKRTMKGIVGQSAVCVHSGHNLGRPDNTPPSSNSIPFCSQAQHSWYPPGWYEWQNFDEDIRIINLTPDALNWYKEQAKSQAADKAWEADDYGVIIAGKKTRYYDNTVPQQRRQWTDANDGTATSGAGVQFTPNIVVNYPTYIAQWDDGPTGDKNIIRFVENADVEISGGGYLEGTLIVKNGDIKFTGGGKGMYEWPVPTDAWKQYCAVNTEAGALEWPGDKVGDLGPPPQQEDYIQFDGAPEPWPGRNKKITFHGFLYVTGDDDNQPAFKDTGGCGIHGTIVVNGEVDSSGGTVVYFDPQVAAEVKGVTQIRRTSWKEVLVKSF